MDATIVGWGHTPFGAHKNTTFEDLILATAQEARDHLGLGSKEIDAIWIGHLNNDLVPDAFPASLALGLHPALRSTPATRVENACVSGVAHYCAVLEAVA